MRRGRVSTETEVDDEFREMAEPKGVDVRAAGGAKGEKRMRTEPRANMLLRVAGRGGGWKSRGKVVTIISTPPVLL